MFHAGVFGLSGQEQLWWWCGVSQLVQSAGGLSWWFTHADKEMAGVLIARLLRNRSGFRLLRSRGTLAGF